MNFFVISMIGGWEVFALVLVILLIFGGRKIPELMRGLGKGVGEFKKGMKENDEDAGKEEKMDK